ncbi:MAG: hypothetical protein CMJ47_01700 [Planctomyces sp.]|nr:hypothetical protein [Planctomyces sp.]
MLAGCSGDSETVYHEYEPEAESVLLDSDSASAERDPASNRETVSTAEDTSTTGSEPETKQLTALASDADPGDTDPGAADAVEMPSTAEKANPVPKVESPQPDTAALEKPSSPVTPSEDVVPASMARMGARTPTDPRSLNQARFEPVEPREPELLIPNKEFRSEGAENALRVTFDDIDLLKVLNMEPVPEDAVKQFPDWLAQLEGKRVRIRGFMFPTLSQTGITYFQHVRDNEICCFGRTPKVYDRISTVLREGETTNYIQGRPFDVVGTFRIDPVYEDGEWLQLYLLEDAIVFP